MQPGCVILQRNRRVRDGKQCLVVGGITHHHIEEFISDLRVVLHEGHVGVHLGDGNERPVRLATRPFGDFQRDVGIAGKAEGHAVFALAKSHQLDENIYPPTVHIPYDMGVIAGDIALLGHRHGFHGARLEVELAHPDVVGQAVLLDGLHVVQVFVIAEQPRQDRAGQPLLDVAGGDGFFQ